MSFVEYKAPVRKVAYSEPRLLLGLKKGLRIARLNRALVRLVGLDRTRGHCRLFVDAEAKIVGIVADTSGSYVITKDGALAGLKQLLEEQGVKAWTGALTPILPKQSKPDAADCIGFCYKDLL